MKLCVIGTGYVGLVSGACLAEVGHEVTCVDLDPDKVARVNAGESPIFEHGLDDLLTRHAGGRLQATTSLEEAFAGADVVLICVGTPFDGQSIDLSYVLEAASQIGRCLADSDHYCVVAVKSTVVPGTTAGPVRDALEAASGKRAGVDFGLGMNPEFLAEGVAVRDFMHPDRIVVGGVDERSTEQLAALYAAFPGVPVVRTRPSTAEMIKYASNAFMATLISFSNEIAECCEATPGVDVADVMRGLHEMKHLNVGTAEGGRARASATSFLWPGCGFGGSCFPKDVKALVSKYQQDGVDTRLLRSVLAINESRPGKMVELLQREFADLEDLPVAVLGLAFKPGTDDVRESPALRVVAALLERGARVTCHDPIATRTGRAALEQAGVPVADIIFETDLPRALLDARAVLLITSWPEYASVPEHLAAAPEPLLLVDGRRFLPPESATRYAGIGQGPPLP